MMWHIVVMLHIFSGEMVHKQWIDPTVKYVSLDECMSYIHSVAGSFQPPPNTRAVFRCEIDERSA